LEPSGLLVGAIRGPDCFLPSCYVEKVYSLMRSANRGIRLRTAGKDRRPETSDLLTYVVLGQSLASEARHRIVRVETRPPERRAADIVAPTQRVVIIPVSPNFGKRSRPIRR
jgi:hypothetical protein